MQKKRRPNKRRQEEANEKAHQKQLNKKRIDYEISFISNYFCYWEKYKSNTKIAEEYYYAGQIIKENDKMKLFDDLPESTQQEILEKLLELIELDFTNWPTGFKDNGYYVERDWYRKSKIRGFRNKIEICELDYRSQAFPRRLREVIDSIDYARQELDKRQICVFQKQF